MNSARFWRRFTRLHTFLIAAFLAACQPTGQNGSSSGPPSSSTDLCRVPTTPIASIQGTGLTSPLTGQSLVVRGVVTLVEPDSGLYLQEPQALPLNGASHGIFIDSEDIAAESSKGDIVALVGTVRELGEREDTLTSIAEIDGFKHCGAGEEPHFYDAHLPLNPLEREAFEGMQVRFEQPLTVTEVRDVRHGEILVSAASALRAPTEIARPGAGAVEQDRKNHARAIPVHNDGLRHLDPYTRIQAGAEFEELSGVLGHDGLQLGLIVEGELSFESPPVPAIPQAEPTAIRVASFNLHEYFNGDGRGGGFPGERGAETKSEFRRQSARIMAAVAEIRPDILAFMELENDGFGPQSAALEFGRATSEALGVPFEVAVPESDRVGTDVISVGLVYRPDRLIAHGPAKLLEGGSFGRLNRVPLAQLFSDRESRERFLVVVNHLKSKGFCPESGPNTDQGDGQACWNPIRAEGARETVRWARRLAEEGGTDKLMMVGDFNAYRLEEPILNVREEGLLELVELHNPDSPQYSYVYRGAAGTLDFAFVSEPLAASSRRAFIWHINAAYPWSGRPSEAWLRSSDHDPVIVDLSFSQSATLD